MNSSLPSSTENTVPASVAPPRDIRLWIVLIIIATVLIALGVRNGAESLFFSLITFLEVVLLFNILIIVHELGHFLAAKWCGLQIDKFAIWFGKPLWSKKIDGVEYILGSIPAGGYVALPQMAPMEAIEGKTETPREELPPASPWQKIIVAFAGPLFSFGLALAFACLVWFVGKPTTYSEKTTIIGYANPDGPAGKAGIQAGDQIKTINGHPIRRWVGVGDGVTWNIVTSAVSPITLVIERAGETKTFEVTPEIEPDQKPAWYQRSVPPRIQIAPDEKDIIVGTNLPNSPAEIAGLKEGDHLVALDGAPLRAGYAIFQHLKNAPNAPLHFTVLRGTETLPIVVTPVKPVSPKDMPKDGPPTNIGLGLDEKADMVLDYPPPLIQVAESADMVRSTLMALITPHSNVGPSMLSGPVGIMNLFSVVLSSPDGWRLALWLAVLINVNLAMLNLFPLPVLDGGHIALSIIEWIRRRPLSMSILEPLQTACALALISFMAYVTFYDVQDSGKMAFGPDGGEIKFAPKQSGQ